MTYRRDPSSSPRQPDNVRGMWCCDDCGAYNDPEEDYCRHCGKSVDSQRSV